MNQIKSETYYIPVLITDFFKICPKSLCSIILMNQNGLKRMMVKCLKCSN